MRDLQRQKVYDWENAIVAPLDRSSVPFNNIQAIVDYVWNAEGLKFPPQVRQKNNTRGKRVATATGNRKVAKFRATVATWIILHELAHSMTMTTFRDSKEIDIEAHGKEFVGVYMKLLGKFLNVDVCMLMATATDRKVKFDIGAKPLFV